MPIDDELRPKIGFAPGGGRGGGASSSQALAGRLAVRSGLSLAVRPGASHRAQRAESQQRVVVKVSFKLHAGSVGSGGAAQVAGNLAAHLKYIQREVAELGDGSPRLLAADAVSAGSTVEAGPLVETWAGDRHHYRIVISPESGGDLRSLEAFGREVMTRVGATLGRPLEWVAAAHTNTDQPHLHVVLRGVAGGEELRLDRKMVTTGIRGMAEDVVTEELGPRTETEIRRAYKEQVVSSAPTELDRILQRSAPDGVVDLSSLRATREASNHVPGRLKTLANMGLAAAEGAHRYRLQPGFIETLRDAETRRHAHAQARRLAPGVRPGAVFATSSPHEDLVGIVKKTGLTEGGKRAFVALETTRGVAYAEVEPEVAPRVREGGVVVVKAAAGGLGEAEAAELRAGRVELRAAGAALRTFAVDQVEKGLGVESEGVVTLNPAAAAYGRRRFGLAAAPPRLGVLAARSPEVALTEPVWSPLDRHVVGGSKPAWPGGEEQLARREAALVQRGMAWRETGGAVRLKRGAADELRIAELAERTREAAEGTGLSPAAARQDREGIWEVVDRVDLAQGPGIAFKQDGRIAVDLLRSVRDAAGFAPGAAVRVEREAGGRGVVLRDADERAPQGGAER